MSDIHAVIAQLASRIRDHADTIQTEEAIKTSVILPFLRGLGYDVFDPEEVIPEFTADTVGKKGEKVDYAILNDREVSILIECKSLQTSLDEKHLGQLYRYFTVTNARFAMLTNGQIYQFYTDLAEPHRLDKRPFFVFDLLDYSDAALSELKKFEKTEFNVENILEQAERLKFVAAIKPVLDREMIDPSDSFIRLVAADVYDGRLNQKVKETLSLAIRAAFREMMRDRVRSRLTSALEDPDPEGDGVSEEKTTSDIHTTQDEIEGYLLVKSILRGTIETDRVIMRDAKSYCAILLDDNNRKPIVRLHFNGRQKHIGVFDGGSDEKFSINSLDEILDFKDRIRNTVLGYD